MSSKRAAASESESDMDDGNLNPGTMRFDSHREVYNKSQSYQTLQKTSLQRKNSKISKKQSAIPGTNTFLEQQN